MVINRQNQLIVPESIETLANKINKIIEVDTSGLVIYLAEEDFSEYPNRNYRNIAFHMNVKTGGVEEASPEDVVKIMSDSGTTNLMWLSNKWKEKDIVFAWIYAHELKHLKQDMLTPHIHNKTKKLFKCYNSSGRSEIKRHELPIEHDADLAAKYVIEQLFSKDECFDFFNSKALSGQSAQSLSFNGTLFYDYEHQTDLLIKKLC